MTTDKRDETCPLCRHTHKSDTGVCAAFMMTPMGMDICHCTNLSHIIAALRAEVERLKEAFRDSVTLYGDEAERARDAALGANLRRMVATADAHEAIYLCLMRPHEHINLSADTLDADLAAAVAQIGGDE